MFTKELSSFSSSIILLLQIIIFDIKVCAYLNVRHMLSKPIKKNNKYVSTTDHVTKYFLSDVKIKSLHKFVDNKGYLISIYIPETVNTDTINNLMEFDDNISECIMKQSPTWFNKTFSNEEVDELYTRSYCKQHHTIDVILSSTFHTKFVINNMTADSIEEVIDLIKSIKHLKKCIINIEIQHIGLYFYQESATNKWIIKSIDITDTTRDACSFVKEDLEDKLEDNIKTLDTKTSAKVKECETRIADLVSNQKNIHDTFELLKSTSGKTWEQTLDKINALILNQEDKIKLF